MKNFTVILCIFMGIFGVLAVVGNVLVIFAIFTCKKLRAAQNVGLMSLACSDVLVGLVSVPVMIFIYIQGLILNK